MNIVHKILFGVCVFPFLFLTFLQSKFVLKYFQKPGVRYFYNTKGDKLITLTIDDGPDPYVTPKILEVLRRYGVKATFFLIGSKIQKYPHVLMKIIDEGHEIANHDMYDFATVLRHKNFEVNLNATHLLLATYASAVTIPVAKHFQQLEKVTPNDKSEEYSGNHWADSNNSAFNIEGQKFFRPGCGFYGNWMLNILKKLNYLCVLGNIYPHDVLFSSSWFVSNYVYYRTTPGSIIILHDARPKLNTDKTLDKIIPKLYNDGYTFAKLSEMERKYAQND